MSSVRIKAGDREPIVAYLTDTAGAAVTGATDCEISIWRRSDEFFYDWSDETFKSRATVSDLQKPLTEVDATGAPGMYNLDTAPHAKGWDTSQITNVTADDTYVVQFFETTGSDFVIPPPIEIKVDQWIADIPADVFAFDISGNANRTTQAGGMLNFVRQIHTNAQRVDPAAGSNGRLLIYADGQSVGGTQLGTFDVSDVNGSGIGSLTGFPYRRERFT